MPANSPDLIAAGRARLAATCIQAMNAAREAKMRRSDSEWSATGGSGYDMEAEYRWQPTKVDLVTPFDCMTPFVAKPVLMLSSPAPVLLIAEWSTTTPAYIRYSKVPYVDTPKSRWESMAVAVERVAVYA